MRRALGISGLVLALAGASAVYALTVSLPLGLSDYPSDARPAIDALAGGHLGSALANPLMGSVSLILRAPFAALSLHTGGGEVLAYRLGLIPCLLALALLVAWLVARMAGAGRPPAARVALVGVVVASPLAHQAIIWGHPEEILAGTLSVAAVLLAARGRILLAGAVLGLALATKQWAVIAILPVAAAAPDRRARLLGVGALVGAGLTLPMLLADSATFVHQQHAIASANSWVGPANVWWPFAHVTHHRVWDGVALHSVARYALPSPLNPIVHPLVVALSGALGLALVARHRRPTLDQALALLGLVFVVRCALDPWDISYYAIPLLICAVARDAVAPRGWPLACGLTGAGLWLTMLRIPAMGDAVRWNACFLLFCGLLAAWLALGAFSPTSLTRLRSLLGRELRAPRPATRRPVAAER